MPDSGKIHIELYLCQVSSLFNYFLLNYSQSQPALVYFSHISHNMEHMRCHLSCDTEHMQCHLLSWYATISLNIDIVYLITSQTVLKIIIT